MDRRDFLKTILATATAPAIVKADNIMKIWTPPEKKIIYPAIEEAFNIPYGGYIALFPETFKVIRVARDFKNNVSNVLAMQRSPKGYLRELTFTCDSANSEIRVGHIVRVTV